MESFSANRALVREVISVFFLMLLELFFSIRREITISIVAYLLLAGVFLQM